MDPFEYNSNKIRTIFGSNTIQQLPSQLKSLNVSRPLFLSTPRATEYTRRLEAICADASFTPAGSYNNAIMHTPIHITEDAVALAKTSQTDCIVSIGGGSTIGLGKAICLRLGIPHICLPTTYAGSEMTPILGETVDGQKTTQSDPKILPDVVIYDVDLTMSLPPSISAVSGVNALAHAVEALYARNKNPIISLLALEGVRALAESLPEIAMDSSARLARERALYGAWLCGTCLGSVGMSLHHKLCHTLGGAFNLPHAETHTIVLPHVLAYNAPFIPDTMIKLASVLPESNGDAIHGLNVLLKKLQVKQGLKDLGMREDDISRAAEMVVSKPYWNPREVTKENENEIKELIRRCWADEVARVEECRV